MTSLGPVADAVTAAYYIEGIETGLLHAQDARDWAFTVIEAQEQPAFEIIEVASARTSAAVCGALAQVAGARDRILAGSWLLHDIRLGLLSGRLSVDRALAGAWQLARRGALIEDVASQVDELSDSVYWSALDGRFHARVGLDLLELARLYGVARPG